MSSLTSLPSELLLRIAGSLRASSECPFEDVKALALVCRKLAPIARDALLREAVIAVQDRDWQGDPARLLHQLLTEYPGIDRKMVSLEVRLTGLSEESFDFHDEATRSMAHTAALMSAVPTLNNLALILEEPFEEEHLYALDEGLFDVLWPQVECMSHLRSLKTNFLPPCSVLAIPSLNTLHFDLDLANALEQTMGHDIFGAMLDDKDPDLTPTVRNVILSVDLDLLIDRGSDDPFYSVRRGLQHFMASLGKIATLQIRLRFPYKSIYDTPRDLFLECPGVRYNGLMQFLALDLEMEAVIIDTCDVDWKICANVDGVQEDSYDAYISDMQEALDVGSLPNTLQNARGLLRFVVPQAALFQRINDWHESDSLKLTRLPPTLESIEIIDSTRAINRWARYVLDHPAEYPCLKTIVLWCDRYTEPLGDDGSIRPVGELCTAWKLDEWKLEVDMSDEVWDEIEEAGIALVVHTERKQGWRQIF